MKGFIFQTEPSFMASVCCDRRHAFTQFIYYKYVYAGCYFNVNMIICRFAVGSLICSISVCIVHIETRRWNGNRKFSRKSLTHTPCMFAHWKGEHTDLSEKMQTKERYRSAWFMSKYRHLPFSDEGDVNCWMYYNLNTYRFTFWLNLIETFSNTLQTFLTGPSSISES